MSQLRRGLDLDSFEAHVNWISVQDLLDLWLHARFHRSSSLFTFASAPLVAASWEKIVIDLLDEHVKDLIRDLDFLARQIICLLNCIQTVNVKETILGSTSTV